MERIALIAGNLVIYWRPLLVTAGAVTAIFFFMALPQMAKACLPMDSCTWRVRIHALVAVAGL